MDEGGRIRIEQKNKFCVGDQIEVMKPDGRNLSVQVRALSTQDGQAVESAPHARQILWVELSGQADRFDLLRVKKAD